VYAMTNGVHPFSILTKRQFETEKSRVFLQNATKTALLDFTKVNVQGCKTVTNKV
jgi:hypothetical protein